MVTVKSVGVTITNFIAIALGGLNVKNLRPYTWRGSVTLVDKDNKHRAIENAANLWANMGVPYNAEEHKQIDTKINENERRRLL